ncbi:hypothetical protein NMG60_11024060 [Bertholletia excelsa]
MSTYSICSNCLGQFNQHGLGLSNSDHQIRPSPEGSSSSPKLIQSSIWHSTAQFYQTQTRTCRSHGGRSNDTLFQAAIDCAALHFQETHGPDPLFVDQYASCFVRDSIQIDLEHYTHHYCLATKFFDNELLTKLKNIDGLKQGESMHIYLLNLPIIVVLFTDGMDTQPYRLSWPTTTLIFDVSLETVFRASARILEAVGAKIQKGCLFLHFPLESSDIQQTLCSKGFNGLPLMNLASFENNLSVVSSLALKGCLFLGELPSWFTEIETGLKTSKQMWTDKLFMSNDFWVNLISYDEVAKNVSREANPKDYKSILFVAEQLQFSDHQMETWRREFQRIEEDTDEEGFEEL